MSRRLAYYEVLGLDAPPADRKAVKRAYSKKLKITRPEDDPDGFMRLRDAHDLALNILAREADDAAWDAQQISVETAYTPDITPDISTDTSTEIAPDTDTNTDPALTYVDMTPETAAEPEPVEPASNTTYAIGATPNLNAPSIPYTPPISEVPKLVEGLDKMLADPTQYNDRENWNVLFRKARKLDIDDYVDFEQILLEKILHFHDYSYDHPLYETPEKMMRKLSPSISASLFKTMSWDQVNKRGDYRGQQIEWLERRMSTRKRHHDPVPIPETDSDGNKKVWAFLFGAFVLVKVIQLLANL